MPDDQEHNPDPIEAADRWDAHDPRRQHDQMAPPSEPCECYCLHCGRIFMSDLIWFQKVIGDKAGFDGFWMCPTPNCDGAGFTFDIFPTDPTHPANAGWHGSDDEEFDDDEFDDAEEPADSVATPYNPEEPEYKAIDQQFGDADDIVEGDEWKLGLEPGSPLPEPPWAAEARRQQEEVERRYDEPDQRPRELDWSNREDRGERLGEDDIPF